MTKEERIRAAIHGEPVDTIPYSMWSHMPGIDLDPQAIAEKTWEFYKQYDIDLVKTMNSGMYSVEDFGCEVDYSAISSGGVAKIVKTPVHAASDWNHIEPVRPDTGSLKRETTYLKLLLGRMKGEHTPVVFTVFSPITTASKLSEGRILEHIKEGHGDAVRRALDAITETTCKLVEQVIGMGAAGIYFASQMSTYDAMTEELYQEYGMPYDLRVLRASKGWCNVLHAHGKNIMFHLLKDYPVQVFNWHAWETLPEIDEAADVTGKCLMGGIERTAITHGDKNALRNQIYHCVKALRGKSHILTPGCVIRYPLDETTLAFVKETKVEMERMLLHNSLS